MSGLELRLTWKYLMVGLFLTSLEGLGRVEDRKENIPSDAAGDLVQRREGRKLCKGGLNVPVWSLYFT